MVDFLFAAWSETAIQNLSIFDPASPPAHWIRNLSLLVFAITGFVFVVVEGVLIYCLWRFWRPGSDGSVEPPQIYGSKPIELAWTAAPTLIVFILVLVIVRTLWEVELPAGEPADEGHGLRVTVIGRQWWWEYVYEQYDGQKLGFVTANELHIPTSNVNRRRPVYLTLKSADVCHSFWVPRLAGKTDLIPERVNHTWFETEKPGLYVGQCAEFCGTQHANMMLRVVAETPEEFERWLSGQQQPAADKPSEGRTVFLSNSCINCHTVRGTPARGTFAPDLTHLMSRKTLAAGMLANNRDNLRAWIDNPQHAKPGCLMPAFKLSGRQCDRVTEYLSTLD